MRGCPTRRTWHHRRRLAHIVWLPPRRPLPPIAGLVGHFRVPRRVLPTANTGACSFPWSRECSQHRRRRGAPPGLRRQRRPALQAPRRALAVRGDRVRKEHYATSSGQSLVVPFAQASTSAWCDTAFPRRDQAAGRYYISSARAVASVHPTCPSTRCSSAFTELGCTPQTYLADACRILTLPVPSKTVSIPASDSKEARRRTVPSPRWSLQRMR